MRLSDVSLLVFLTAALVISTPFNHAAFEARRVYITTAIYGITKNSTGSLIIPSNVDAACIVNVTVTAGETCGDLATKYNILLSADDKSNLASSDVCRDIMAGFRICTLLSAGSANSTSARGTSRLATLPPHSTTLGRSVSSAALLSRPSPSTEETSILTYTPTLFPINTTTGSQHSYTTITAIRTTPVTPVAASGTWADVSLTYYTTRIYTYPTTTTRPAFSASANVTQSPTANLTSQTSSSYHSTATLAHNGSSCTIVAAPGPTQEGINSGCNKWYVVEEGDSCSGIAEKNDITEDEFDDWNPYVGGPDCDTLFAGDAVCVGVCTGSGQSGSSTSTAKQSGTSSPFLSFTGFLTSTSTSFLSSRSSMVPASQDILTASRISLTALTRSISGSSRSTSSKSSSSDSYSTVSILKSSSSGTESSSMEASRISSSSSLAGAVASSIHTSTIHTSTTHISSSSITSTLHCSTSPSSSRPTTSSSSLSSLISSSPIGSQTSSATSTTSVSASSSASSTSTGTAYTLYIGNGSTAAGWPAQSQWVEFDTLFENNTPHMTAQCAAYNAALNTDAENADIKIAIQDISTLTGVDARFILAIIMQESWGCVRVPSTSGSVTNSGLMQSHDGQGSCNNGAVIQSPCPYSEIYQMVLDGTNGTRTDPLTTGDGGDGLRQTLVSQVSSGYAGAQAYYRAARMYNGGSITFTDMGEGCCTACYVSDVANRLMGWYGWTSGCNSSTAA